MSQSIEVAREERSIGQLLQDAGDVMFNPLLRQIIAASTSATSVEQHVFELGWGHVLAKKVRAAMLIRNHFSHVWESALSDDYSAEKQSLFDFGLPDDGSGWSLPHLMLSGTMYMDIVSGSMTKQRFLPFILREYRPACGNTEEHVNSFAAPGKPPVKVRNLKDKYSWMRPDPTNDVLDQVDSSSCVSYKLFSLNAGTRYVSVFQQGALSIYSRSVMLEQNPASGRIFPQFYRLVEVVRVIGNREERIKLWVRQDFGPGRREKIESRPPMEGLVYEMDLRVAAPIQLEVRVPFHLWRDRDGFRVDAADQAEPFIATRFVEQSERQGSTLTQNDFIGAEKAYNIASETAKKLYLCRKPNLHLLKMFPLNFFKHPPLELTDLFCN